MADQLTKTDIKNIARMAVAERITSMYYYDESHGIRIPEELREAIADELDTIVRRIEKVIFNGVDQFDVEKRGNAILEKLTRTGQTPE